MVDFFEVTLSFVFGVAIGVIAQYLRFRYTSRIEKMKRLARYLEGAYPIIEKLGQDSGYAAKIQLQDDEEHFSMVLGKIATALEEYIDWFSVFRQDGMVPELESLNLTLSKRFSGLFTHARFSRRHGSEYLSQRIQLLAEYCDACEQELRIQLFK